MKRLHGVCAIVLLAAVGLIVAGSPAQALPVKRIVLKNGAVLLVSPQHNLPMVTMTMAFDAGSRRDPADKPGLAHLTADCLAEGTTKMSADELNRQIDFYGSGLEIGADRDYATAGITSLKQYWPNTLKLLVAVLTTPALKDADIIRKRGEDVAAIKTNLQDPGYTAEVAFIKRIFGDTPYGHPIEGYADSVAKLTPTDVRDFYHEFYRPQGAVIAVVGDVDPDQVAATLNSSLTSLTGAPPAQAPFPPPALPATSKLDVINRDITQANVIIGGPGIARANPDFYRIQVMNYIFGGGGFASHLVQTVRSKAGLAYSVESVYQAALFPGSFQVILETKNQSTNEAIRMVVQQMRLMQEGPVKATELESAKKYLIGSFPLKLDTQSSIASFLLQVEIYHLGLDYADRYPKLIDAVSAQDVLNVARKYLHPDNLLGVAVADQPQAKVDVASLRAR